MNEEITRSSIVVLPELEFQSSLVALHGALALAAEQRAASEGVEQKQKVRMRRRPQEGSQRQA